MTIRLGLYTYEVLRHDRLTAREPIEDAHVLGLKAVHGNAKVYAPWVERILSLPLSSAPRHDQANFGRFRRKLRTGKVPIRHGAGLYERIRRELTVG